MSEIVWHFYGVTVGETGATGEKAPAWPSDMPTPGIELGLHWCEARALTIEPAIWNRAELLHFTQAKWQCEIETVKLGFGHIYAHNNGMVIHRNEEMTNQVKELA